MITTDSVHVGMLSSTVALFSVKKVKILSFTTYKLAAVLNVFTT